MVGQVQPLPRYAFQVLVVHHHVYVVAGGSPAYRAVLAAGVQAQVAGAVLRPQRPPVLRLMQDKGRLHLVEHQQVMRVVVSWQFASG